MPEPSDGISFEQTTQGMLHEQRRACPTDSQRLTQKDQRGGHRHEQQVFNHVSRQQVVVVVGEWRSACQPNDEQTYKETGSSPTRNGRKGTHARPQPSMHVLISSKGKSDGQ